MIDAIYSSRPDWWRAKFDDVQRRYASGEMRHAVAIAIMVRELGLGDHDANEALNMAGEKWAGTNETGN